MKPKSEKLIYVATSLFSEPEQAFGYRLTDILEQSGANVYYPWRDAGDAQLKATWGTNVKKINEGICENNLGAIVRAVAVVAVLEGADVDSGVSMELGYAFALGKPIWGLRTDFRTQGAHIGSVNIMLLHVCKEVFSTTTELVSALRSTELLGEKSELSVSSFYDKIAGEYSNERLHRTTAACKRAEESLVAEFLGEQTFSRALDIGCGDGNFLLNVKADEKVGADVSAAMLGKHKAKLPSATYLLCNGADLSLIAGSFDLIHCSFVLDHIRDKVRFYSDLVRLSSQQSAIIISCFEAESLKRLRKQPEILAYQTATGGQLSVSSHLESVEELEAGFAAYFEVTKRRIKQIEGTNVSIVTWLLRVR